LLLHGRVAPPGGCIPISGATSIGGFFRENGLTFPTGGPGVPLLSGAANLPQWGAQPGSTGVYALDLQTGNYGLALATEVPNSSSGTGASPNLLAKITTGASGGATTATTSATDATVPTYIVVSGNGTTGNAQLAVDGQASCGSSPAALTKIHPRKSYAGIANSLRSMVIKPTV
jgi:hypothetical protein